MNLLFFHMPKLDESIKANLFDGNNQSINKKKFNPVYECGYCLVFGLVFNNNVFTNSYYSLFFLDNNFLLIFFAISCMIWSSICQIS